MISEKEDSRQNNTREVRLGSNESPNNISSHLGGAFGSNSNIVTANTATTVINQTS